MNNKDLDAMMKVAREADEQIGRRILRRDHTYDVAIRAFERRFTPTVVLRLLEAEQQRRALMAAAIRVRARCQSMRFDQDATAALDDLSLAITLSQAGS